MDWKWVWKQISLALLCAVGLALAPAVSALLEWGNTLLRYGQTPGFYLYGLGVPLACALLGAYMVLHGALTRGLVWPSALTSAAALALSVCSNYLLATIEPALHEFYFMDRLHFWPILFGFFLARAIVEARRRRRAGEQGK